MSSEIEFWEKRRMRYLEGLLVGFVVFMILSIIRFFFRTSGLNSTPIGYVVLGGMVSSVLVLALGTYGLAKMSARFKQNPALKEALMNELVTYIELKSWKAAYIGAIATTVFFAITCFFYPVYDPVLISLTAIVAGAGSYFLTFYIKYRSL